MNGDGVPDYGHCRAVSNGDTPEFLWFVYAPYMQTKGTEQGYHFDVDTFKPLLKNPGFYHALDIMRESIQV